MRNLSGRLTASADRRDCVTGTDGECTNLDQGAEVNILLIMNENRSQLLCCLVAGMIACPVRLW